MIQKQALAIAEAASRGGPAPALHVLRPRRRERGHGPECRRVHRRRRWRERREQAAARPRDRRDPHRRDALRQRERLQRFQHGAGDHRSLRRSDLRPRGLQRHGRCRESGARSGARFGCAPYHRHASRGRRTPPSSCTATACAMRRMPCHRSAERGVTLIEMVIVDLDHRDHRGQRRCVHQPAVRGLHRLLAPRRADRHRRHRSAPHDARPAHRASEQHPHHRRRRSDLSRVPANDRRRPLPRRTRQRR